MAPLDRLPQSPLGLPQQEGSRPDDPRPVDQIGDPLTIADRELTGRELADTLRDEFFRLLNGRVRKDA